MCYEEADRKLYILGMEEAWRRHGVGMKEALEAGINHRVAGQIKANDREKQMCEEYISDNIMRAEMELFECVI